jgi:transposase-like protein
VASKRYQNRGLRTYWAVHIEAWRLSGLSRAAYCGEHQLKPGVFSSWLKKIGDADALRHKPSSKRKPPPRRSTSEVRNRAVQAFWAMHVEAQMWSGLSAAEYASAHRLTPSSLRQWRQRLDEDPLGIDWRELVHPSARPYASPRRSTSAKARTPESGLTDATRTILDGDGRSSRRTFSDEQRRAIVAETQAPGATVSAVARKHGVVTSMVFRWRAQMGLGQDERAKLARVRLVGDGLKAAGQTPTAGIPLPIPEGAVAVDLADGRRVFAPPGSDPDEVRRYVAQREAAR